MRDLLDKVILITGASSGIGQATAKLVATMGAKVIIHYHTNKQGAIQAVQEIQGNKGTAIALQADLTSKEEIDAMMEEVLSILGSIDVLVNNAGGGIQQSTFMDMSIDLWEETFRLNVHSVLLCSQAVLEHMIPKKSGKIINITSAAARIGGAGESIHYASSKGAVQTMTLGMSRELIDHGIIVNAVAPGMVNTPFHQKFAPNDNRLERMVANVPIKRAAEPREVAESIAFLCSDASNYIVGETINVTGGR